MTEPEGIYAQSLKEIMSAAVFFRDDRGFRDGALVYPAQRSIALEDGHILRGDVRAGIDAETAMANFGFARLLVVAAGDPTAFTEIGVTEGRLRHKLSSLAREEATELRRRRSSQETPAEGTDSRIMWDIDTKRLRNLHAFATNIIARPKIGPGNPPAARK
jgi:hypothetical protein